MIRIGLTGGIAAGKSTASAHLAELGACVIDYDALARDIVKPGGVALPRIVQAFGPEALNADGSLNRAWVAAHVFSPSADPQALARLNAIEHPLIIEQAVRLEHAHPEARLVVHDIPLLVEILKELPFRFDHIITVEAPEEERITRMITQRGMTRSQATDRIRHQSTRAEREAIADIILDSTQPVEHTFEYLDTLVAQWRREA